MTAESTTKTYCSQRVYAGSFHAHTCPKPVTCERNGKPYCTIHDPERVAAKKAEKSAAWDAEWKRKQALTAEREARQAHAAHCVAVHEQLVEALAALKGTIDTLSVYGHSDATNQICKWLKSRDSYRQASAALEKADTK